jgi:hypothetical protein
MGVATEDKLSKKSKTSTANNSDHFSDARELLAA